jgi:arylsulfatase A-like enzyme
MTIDTRAFRTKPPEQQQAMLARHPPDFEHRTSIRSIFDGRYRFSRYFSPVAFNTPKTMEELLAMNDLEVYDLQADPDEMANLALDPKKNGDLILALNQVTNERIADEVGVDDGSFLPIRNGKWAFPPLNER